MPFQIHALPMCDFEHLFKMSDKDLQAHRAMRITADSKPGYPCRVSLEEAEIGEELVLANHAHRAENTPYRATHAIYVRKIAEQATPGPSQVPKVLACRLLSIRGFDKDHLMKRADVVEGSELGDNLDALFGDPAIEYVHIHNAKQGCFAARATR